MPVKAPPASTADKYPGAGAALLLTLAELSSTPAPPSSSKNACAPPVLPPPTLSSSPAGPSSGPSSSQADEDWRVICQQVALPPVDDVATADELLERGIADYTVVEGVPLLGKGKFSVVYRATKGGREFAIKHTPLHPHHPLIATRLIREPELLAKLDPHPNLIRVFETIRTEGHFYLVEEYLPSSISLDAFCLRFPSQRLPFPLVRKILRQLVSVVRDGLHKHCVCHRDIKPENILIDPDTAEVCLIDFGLATHFSLSSPKLSTCCGSPAFHCPEIVLSLSRSAGEVRYWGPEVDVWCVALSVLRCWTGRRYPIGTGHKSLSVMRGRVQDLLALISRDLMDGDGGERRSEERQLREALGLFLDLDGGKRMKAFQAFDVGDEVRESVERFRRVREFKQTTFHDVTPKYTLPLQLVAKPSPPALPSAVLSSTTGTSSPTLPRLANPPSDSTLVLRNPTDQHPVKVVSFLKYALRCANILYHCRSTETQELSVPGTPVRSIIGYFQPQTAVPSPPLTPVPDLVANQPSPLTIFQCVATLPPLAAPPPPPLPENPSKRPFLPSLFRSSTSSAVLRSASTPPNRSPPPQSGVQQDRSDRRAASSTRAKGGQDASRFCVFLFALRFSSPSAAAVAEERRQRRQRSASRRGGSRSRTSLRFPTAADATQDFAEQVSFRLTAGSEAERRTRPTHSRQTSCSGLSGLHPDSLKAAPETGRLTPTTVSRHSSIGRERSTSGSASTESASADSTPPPSPALESLKNLAMEPPLYNNGARSQRSSTVRPTSLVRSLSTAGAHGASLSRSSTSSSYGQGHISSHHPPAYLAEPVVLIHVSDPLALPALRSAFSAAPQTPLVHAGTPLVHSSSLKESPPAIAIPLCHPPARARPLAERNQDNEEADDEPRRGRSEARSADSYSPSSHSGSGSSSSKLARSMAAAALATRGRQQNVPALRDESDDRTPTATPAPTDRQRVPPPPTPPTPALVVAHADRTGSVSSEDSNDGPLSPPPLPLSANADGPGSADATRIIDARKNSGASASSIGELFEGLGLRDLTGSGSGEQQGREKSPVGLWSGVPRGALERSRSVGLGW